MEPIARPPFPWSGPGPILRFSSIADPARGTLVTARLAYTASNGRDTVSGHRIGRDGRLALLDAGRVSAVTGGASIDLAVTGNGRFLHVVNAPPGTVGEFLRRPGGW